MRDLIERIGVQLGEETSQETDVKSFTLVTNFDQVPIGGYFSFPNSDRLMKKVNSDSGLYVGYYNTRNFEPTHKVTIPAINKNQISNIDESLIDRLDRLEVLHESQELMETKLSEAMTYDQLVAATSDHWARRLETVKYVQSSPPDVVVLEGGDVDLVFAYRSHKPQGSGETRYGAIVFAPDRNNKAMAKLKSWWQTIKDKVNKWRGQKVPTRVLTGADLRHMKCKVTCSCPDFLYRMEVANHAHGASDIQHSNGARPKITNPKLNPGLCKHLLATLKYLTTAITVDAVPEETPKDQKKQEKEPDVEEEPDQNQKQKPGQQKPPPSKPGTSGMR